MSLRWRVYSFGRGKHVMSFKQFVHIAERIFKCDKRPEGTTCDSRVVSGPGYRDESDVPTRPEVNGGSNVIGIKYQYASGAIWIASLGGPVSNRIDEYGDLIAQQQFESAPRTHRLPARQAECSGVEVPGPLKVADVNLGYAQTEPHVNQAPGLPASDAPRDLRPLLELTL